MTRIVKLNSGSKFEEKNSFSRAIRVGNWVYSSNSSGRDYKTHQMPSSPAEQLNQAFNNIERAFLGVGANLVDAIRVQISFCNLHEQDVILEAFARRFKNIDPVLTLVCQPFFGTELKVEAEIIAYICADDDEVERKRI